MNYDSLMASATSSWDHIIQNRKSVTMDLIDRCNLCCPTCYRGQRYMKNTTDQIDFEYFKKIVDKAELNGIYDFFIFNWTEPFLTRNLSNYLKYIKKKKLHTILSSNLSINCIDDFIQSLRYCDDIVISVSGFSDSVCTVNHKGMNIDFVKKNLEIIAAAKKNNKISTKVWIHYFLFDYSKHEYQAFKDYVDNLELNIVPWIGGGSPKTQVVGEPEDNTDNKFFENFVNHDAFIRRNPQRIKTLCPVSSYPIPIDCRGEVFLCCHVPNCESTHVGNFLNEDFDVLMAKRFTHPLCTSCKKNFDWQPLNSHEKAMLISGVLKLMDTEDNSQKIQEFINIAEQLSGRDIIVWGCGEMFSNMHHIFSKSNIKVILSDLECHPDSICGIPITHPDHVLANNCNTIPIVVFCSSRSFAIINKKLKYLYPMYNEIYHIGF